MGQQAVQLARVKEAIGDSIAQFFVDHSGQQFHMEDLRQHVLKDVPNCAPDSPSRVMRWMRQHEGLAYTLVSRRDSLYHVGMLSK